MDKLKKFLLENKVLLFLAIILILWLVAFIVIIVIFFYGSSESVYGNRLDNIQDKPITDTLKNDITTTFTKDNLASNVTINVKGAIIYVNVTCNDGVKLTDVKQVSESIIKLFSESLLNNYDIDFMINVPKDDKGKSHMVMGVRNANSDGTIVWNNYSTEEPVKEESSAE